MLFDGISLQGVILFRPLYLEGNGKSGTTFLVSVEVDLTKDTKERKWSDGTGNTSALDYTQVVTVLMKHYIILQKVSLEGR